MRKLARNSKKDCVPDLPGGLGRPGARGEGGSMQIMQSTKYANWFNYASQPLHTQGAADLGFPHAAGLYQGFVTKIPRTGREAKVAPTYRKRDPTTMTKVMVIIINKLMIWTKGPRAVLTRQ